MGLFSGIVNLFGGGFVKEVGDAIDKNITSDEEKLQLRNDLAKINTGYKEKLLAMEGKFLDAEMKVHERAAEVSKEEIKSNNWFIQSYKQIIVVCMFALIVANYFGLLATPLPDIVWTVFGAQFGVMGVRRLFPNGNKV